MGWCEDKTHRPILYSNWKSKVWLTEDRHNCIVAEDSADMILPSTLE
jgi:hypothetical protein